MNEQNWPSNRYANQLSSIFEFQFSFEIDYSIIKQLNNHKTEELNLYLHTEEIFHFRYILTQSKITFFQSVQWKVS